MARRGPRPGPSHLRLVDGTYRADRHGPAQHKLAGRPEMPKRMRGAAAEAWRQFIEPAGWLDKFREPSAIAFCELWAEFREMPARFVASRHAQMRAYMAELGLSDERNRPVQPEAPDEFFDD